MAFRNRVIFHKQMACGLPGVERSLAGKRRREQAGICNKLVEIELLPDALAPEMKGNFNSLNSSPSSFNSFNSPNRADFIGKSTQSRSQFIPGSFIFVVSTSKWKRPDFSLVLLIRRGQSSLPPSRTSFMGLLTVWCNGTCAPKGPGLH